MPLNLALEVEIVSIDESRIVEGRFRLGRISSLGDSVAECRGVRGDRIGDIFDMSETENYIELAAEIVSAYVSNNSVPASELATLLGDIHAAIVRVASGTVAPTPEVAKPAVPPKKSVTNEFIVCLEDGRKFKSLKRHLRTQYNMSPEQYREKWGLPADYPMVAPAYAKARSALAKQMGLGQQRRRRAK